MRRFVIVLLLMQSLLPLAAALAAPVVYCAGSATAVKGAFHSATIAAEGTQHDIRVAASGGAYLIDAALSFLPDGSHDNKDFSLSGGWNADCTSQTINPSNTVLKFTAASSAARAVDIEGNNHSYAVRGIRFDHASTFTLIDPTCVFPDSCPDTESIVVEFNDFRYMNQVHIQTGESNILRVSSNLFAHFSGSPGANLVEIEYYNYENPPTVNFNTFGAMQCGTGGSLLLYQQTAHPSKSVIDHNIFDSTGCTYDIYLKDGVNEQPTELTHNLFKNYGGNKPPSSTSYNLVGVDPSFVDPANDDFHLRTSAPVSAAIDAGMTLTELALDLLYYPGQDLDDTIRIKGAYFDLGAFESTGPVPTVLSVTNTNDSGAGSLRQAITTANNTAGKQSIVFSLPGACPQKIALQSPLPDITDDLEIDGYTQSGSQLNYAHVASTAIICVVLGPANGVTLDHSINVPSTVAPAMNLIVSGIGFTGGHSGAMKLQGGTGHQVWGNAFGGVRPGGNDSLGSTNISHLSVRANALGVTVGGDNDYRRNWFGASKLNAILLLDAGSGGHALKNNYIGLDPGGAVPQPLGGIGISAQDSSGILIEGNVIDGGTTGIRIAGSTATGFSIKGNRIGQDAYGGNSASAANDYGIQITEGAHGNTIGTLDGKTPSNIIANNTNAGVWIDSTAGSGNVVRPNSIYGNGTSGTGLGVDLGALGPLTNDPLDADGGPNSDQNAPVLTGSSANADGTRQVTGRLTSTVTTTFHIDIYRSPTCAGGNRGGDAKTLLNTTSVFDITTGPDGKANFSVKEPGVGAPGYITAIATNTQTGDTSEVGRCYFEDTIFSSDTELELL